jgi:hypothetical protein
MSLSQPPRHAIRLMQRAGVDPSIVGDLIEEHSKGRSTWWFWKQAIVASVRMVCQRISIARVGSTVLVICGGLFALMSPLLGFRFEASAFFLGALVVLCGTLGYFSAAELRTIFWREINIDWLGGLTRPPIYELRKKRV